MTTITSYKNSLCATEMCLGQTYGAESLLVEHRLFWPVPLNTQWWSLPYSIGSPRDSGKHLQSSPCNFCLNRNTCGWQNYLTKNIPERHISNQCSRTCLTSLGTKALPGPKGTDLLIGQEAPQTMGSGMATLHLQRAYLHNTSGGPAGVPAALEGVTPKGRAHNQKQLAWQSGHQGFSQTHTQSMTPGPLQVSPGGSDPTQ